MESLTSGIIRTGSSQPLPRSQRLQAGPLSLLLEEGALRSIYLGSQEILRGIYMAVRDHNWETIAPRFLTYEVETQAQAFQVRLSVEHVNHEVDFVWQGTISGNREGEVTFTFDGQARRSFQKNRIGFCVLHPMSLAGATLEVETPDGTTCSTFPLAISPHQPFKAFTSMRYSCPPAIPGQPEIRMELRFSGELFEMEDQRNWTDASYKTYCTPLHLPFPVELVEGQRVFQRVTLRPLHTPPSSSTSKAGLPAEPLRVKVTTKSAGTLPEIGFGLAAHAIPFSDAEAASLRALHPAYLWKELDLAQKGWEQTLIQSQEDAALLQSALELSIVCDDEGRELEALFRTLAAHRVEIVRLCCFSRTSHVTTRTMLEQARAWRQAQGLRIQLGAGSRANFAEFNRANLPFDLAELATYALNPQVHAFDNRSLVETLQAQPVTVLNAQRLAAGLPLSVGPITFKPRFNAVATSSAEQGLLPASIDPRQMSLFGAGWTVGSLSRLAGARPRWLTWYETTGQRGLLEQEVLSEPHHQFPRLPGALFPLYHVFADIAEFRHGELLAVEISDAHTIEALAVHQDQRLLLLLANLSEQPQTLQLVLPELIEPLKRTLDETTVAEAMYRPTLFRQHTSPLPQNQSGQCAIELPPFAVMRVEGQLLKNR